MPKMTEEEAEALDDFVTNNPPEVDPSKARFINSTNSQDIKCRIYNIEDIKRIVMPIAREYGVGKISLFGSYARGEAESHSDIDLLITDKGNLRGLFDLAGMCEDLKESFGIQVDLATENSLWPEIREYIRKDEVEIYAV